MTNPLQSLVPTFKAINSEKDFNEFLNKFALAKIGIKDQRDEVLGVYEGSSNGKYFTVTHTGYDRCRVFSIQPDVNKLLLDIEGEPQLKASYLDDR